MANISYKIRSQNTDSSASGVRLSLSALNSNVDVLARNELPTLLNVMRHSKLSTPPSHVGLSYTLPFALAEGDGLSYTLPFKLAEDTGLPLELGFILG